MGSSNGQQSSPVVLPQIIYKGQLIQSKKLTILIQSKKNLQWIQQTLIIENKRIKFINQNLELMMAYISKIKMFFSSVNSSHREYLKLKVTYKNQDYFFACSNKRTVDNVSEYYFVFSRIIQDKLVQIGFEPKKNEATIFPNYMNLKDAPQNLRTSAVVYGNILKKSQVLGNWETRFIYITDKEIGSSKKPNDKPSMIIPASTITQLWTRFDIQSNNMLNIKIMYNSGTKTEFGIPLSNFTDEFNWLYSFFKIIKPRD